MKKFVIGGLGGGSIGLAVSQAEPHQTLAVILLVVGIQLMIAANDA